MIYLPLDSPLVVNLAFASEYGHHSTSVVSAEVGCRSRMVTSGLAVRHANHSAIPKTIFITHQFQKHHQGAILV